MKASELKRESISIEKIFKDIEGLNKNNPDVFKHFIPHFVRVDSDVIGKLVENGFKVSNGQWFANDHGIIIEW